MTEVVILKSTLNLLSMFYLVLPCFISVIFHFSYISQIYNAFFMFFTCFHKKYTILTQEINPTGNQIQAPYSGDNNQ